MRKYLKDLNIVQAMLVFREGELLHVCLRYYLKHVNKIVILLDNHDKESERIVLKYKRRFPDRIVVAYSTVPVIYANKRRTHKMYHRFKFFEGDIRQRLLDVVKKEHEKTPIDLLYWFDADEVPTNHFPKVLEHFWESDKKALLVNYIHTFNGFDMISNDHIRGHCRVFKYHPRLTGYPFKGLAQLIPVKNSERMKVGFVDIHMSDFNIEYIKKRNIYQKRCKAGHKFKDKKLWKIDKDARDLTTKEYKHIIRRTSPLCTMAEYLKEHGVDEHGIEIPKRPIKLNLGSGNFPLPEPEFINLDKRKYRWHFQDGLNYFDRTVDAITISHAIMYLTKRELVDFLGEAYRVLKRGGVIRITEDNATDPNSGVYGGWRGAVLMTDAKVIRECLEANNFEVYDTAPDETKYIDKSLIQQLHGVPPRVFHIEGIKRK